MLDTSITIKVVLNDIETRRFKLALKDLGPSVLPDKVRWFCGLRQPHRAVHGHRTANPRNDPK